jgi:hypothetical protein
MAIKSESQYVVADTIIAWKRNFKDLDYNSPYTASVTGLTDIFIQTIKEHVQLGQRILDLPGEY